MNKSTAAKIMLGCLKAPLFKEGMTVRVKKDDGSFITTKTTSEPWQLGNGMWLIGLEGISGGYSLTRVQKI